MFVIYKLLGIFYGIGSLSFKRNDVASHFYISELNGAVVFVTSCSPFQRHILAIL